MPYEHWIRGLAKELEHHFSKTEIRFDDLLKDFSDPPNFDLGHVALPCYRFAKLLKLSPDKIAASVASTLTISGAELKASGPYLNFKREASKLYDDVTRAIEVENAQYGGERGGRGHHIALEYCSPNIAKKLAFHHIRSTVLGHVLANIFSFHGYEVTRINFVGDWGSQFARLMAAFELWGDKGKLAQNIDEAMDHLSEIYVQFHDGFEDNPARQDATNRCLKRLEEKDAQAIALWTSIREISLKAMEKTLLRMGVYFDQVEGESSYLDGMGETFKDLREKSGARLSEGAWIVDVEGLSTPALIQKKDGTTLYLTRDIAAAASRFHRLHFHQMLYVVSEQQKLHFQLLFGVLKKMGYEFADNLKHVSFGTVLLGTEKMSTRKGTGVLLEDVLEEAKKRALSVCMKNPELKNREEVAEQIGLSAILFGELSSHRMRDIQFDWENVLSLDGETGPYVQYSLVRCYSLLEKAKKAPIDASGTGSQAYTFSIEEERLLLCLSKFRFVLKNVIAECEPFFLTRYLIEVAKAFNRFYYAFPVLQAKPSERVVRLRCVEMTRVVLENGLRCLGIPCPKEM